MTTVRLQKALAEKGLASRRGAEKLISEGKVRVNGKLVTELGSKVDPQTDLIEVDAAALAERTSAQVVLMLNKPLGVVSTRSKGEGKSVLDLVAAHPRGKELNPVGRLDKDSCGMLLLTNDGILQYAIVNPESHLEKEYEVHVKSAARDSQLSRMAEGLKLDGSMTRPVPIHRMSHSIFRMILTEGRNRQIRRMAEKVGLEVIHLKRLRIGPLELGQLGEGEWRDLSGPELAKLKEAVKSWQKQP